MHVRLVKSFGFESAHWLPTFPEGHKCRRMHGHSFMVEIVVEGDVPEEKGYLIDFGEIRKVIDPVQKRLDHRVLNEIAGLTNPTSEVLARWIWQEMKPALPILAEVIVHETCTSRCHYRGG